LEHRLEFLWQRVDCVSHKRRELIQLLVSGHRRQGKPPDPPGSVGL
jgi:hypothetical protein